MCKIIKHFNTWLIVLSKMGLCRVCNSKYCIHHLKQVVLKWSQDEHIYYNYAKSGNICHANNISGKSKKEKLLSWYCYTLHWGQPHGSMRVMKKSNPFHNFYSASILICSMPNEWQVVSVYLIPRGNLQSETKHGQMHHRHCLWIQPQRDSNPVPSSA